jgi:GxxExxY protein
MVREIPYLDTDYQEFHYKELIEKVITIFNEVYNKLGYGFLEKVYKDAMMIEFKKEGIPSISQSGIRLFYKGEIIDEQYADMLVDNKVIVMIKAAKGLVEDNEAQLIHCLKATDSKAGVLLNFGIKPDVKLMYL